MLCRHRGGRIEQGMLTPGPDVAVNQEPPQAACARMTLPPDGNGSIQPVEQFLRRSVQGFQQPEKRRDANLARTALHTGHLHNSEARMAG